MIKLYIKKILNKEITLAEVPSLWQESVKKELQKIQGWRE